MITVECEKHIALESKDHTNPIGCVQDNNTNYLYLMQVKKYFNKSNISVMDLGCAGGQMVIDHTNMNDIAVGLEGSSHVLNGKGAHNWTNYKDKNLFLCDITEEFLCKNNNEQIIFDYIQLWEVFEHIPEEKLSQLFLNINKHLSDGGLLCGSISTIPCDSGNHVCIKPKEWWILTFKNNGFELNEYIFNYLPRGIDPSFPFTARKIKNV
jgi:2-polyprenyl-3-methyl-5-hydroxy-6-metoxy-1,4-benzoquinol methylase